MGMMLTVLVVAMSLLLAPASVAAHHAFAAEFDVDSPIQLQGTVTRVEWINPHTWIHLEVRDERGSVTSWAIEGGSPNALLRRGFRATSLPPGTEILVDGYRSRDGGNKANGRDITLPSGEKLFLASSVDNR